jgi:hypothetical protein
MVISFQLALAAAAQRLSNGYGGPSLGNVVNPAQDLPILEVVIQSAGAAAFMGDAADVTSTEYGTTITTTNEGVHLGPFAAGALKLSDLWVAGAGATLHVTAVTF